MPAGPIRNWSSSANGAWRRSRPTGSRTRMRWRRQSRRTGPESRSDCGPPRFEPRSVGGQWVWGGVVAAWWMDRQETRKRAEIDAKENERKLAAAQAEFDRDARKQQAEERVPRLMEQALALRRQCKFREAENLLNQAAALASNGLTPLLVDQVGLAKEDLEVVERLDDIRMKQSIRIIELGGKWTYDTAKAPAMYLAVFRQRGFDFEHDEPARLAAWVDGSRVKVELVAALDDWAVFEPDPTL